MPRTLSVVLMLLLAAAHAEAQSASRHHVPPHTRALSAATSQVDASQLLNALNATSAIGVLTANAIAIVAPHATIVRVTSESASGLESRRHRRSSTDAAARAPCVGPNVEITRLHSRAAYRGPLVDCHGRPLLRALAAMATIASPNAANERWAADVQPVTTALRRALPALRWSVSDSEQILQPNSCPRGQEEVADHPANGSAETAPVLQRSPDSHRGARRVRQQRRVSCRAIAVAHDVHTRDPVVEVDGHVRVIHPRLLEVLARVTHRWPGHRVEIVSGYRPSSNPHAGTRHAHARALDFRVVGVSRESLRDFARTLPLLGVGYYPHSVFVHVDIRDASEGSARWTDYSEPGERPRYGHWPPRAGDVAREINHITSRVNEALEDAEQHEAVDQTSVTEQTVDEPTVAVARATEEGTVTSAAPSAGPGSH